MKQIEQFNRLLNHSRRQDKKDDPLYREQIDTIVRSILREKPANSQACIIGAGPCTDFSLTAFLESCSRVIVTDVDQQSLDDCVKNKQRTTTKVVEYTGFDDVGFFELFGPMIWQSKTEEDIDQFFTKMIENVKEYRFLQDYENKNDLVFVSPIYTQLLYQQMMLELGGLVHDGYDEALAQHCQERFLDVMLGVIERFNQNLIPLLKDDGTLLVLSDVFELEHDSDFYRKVVHSIKQKDVMDEIYHTYLNTYGYGLGDYGLEDLKKHLAMTKSRWLLWRYNDDKSYAVHLCIYTKNTKNKGGTK
jgi:hypothetical protein